jgi:hypothetical protein
MPKIRFAIILPIFMLCAAFAVARWEHQVQADVPTKREYPLNPTATLVYNGINAPAMIFSKLCVELFPIYRVDRTPASFVGLGVEECLFLFGVVVLWSVVGLALDRRRCPNGLLHRTTSGRVLFRLFLVALGTLLFYTGLIPLRNPRNSTNPLGNVMEGLLFLVWSLVLALPAGLAVFKKVTCRSSFGVDRSILP